MDFSLQDLAQQNPIFKKLFQESQKRAHQQMQIALYSDLEIVENIIPSKPLQDQYNNPICIFIATSDSFSETITQKIYLRFLQIHSQLTSSEKRNLHPRISIILINNPTYKNSYRNLIHILKFTPPQFLKKIKQIVIINDSKKKIQLFKSKDLLDEYLKKITLQINDIYALQGIGLWGAFHEVASIYKDKQQKSGKMSDYRKNYFKAANFNSTLVFDLNEIVGENKKQKHHPTIQSYQLNQLQVPNVLVMLTCLLKQKQENLRTEGIFRKSVNVDNQKRALKSLDSENYLQLQSITDPHMIATLIRKIFMRLDPPLFPFEVYQVIIQCQFTSQSGFYLAASIISKLSPPNYMTLKYIIWFFKQFILPFKSQNKMSSDNLARVFAVSFIKSSYSVPNQLENIQKSIVFVRKIIDQSEKLFEIVDKIKNINIKEDNITETKQISQEQQNLKQKKQQELVTHLSQSEEIINRYTEISHERSTKFFQQNIKKYIDAEEVQEQQYGSDPQKEENTDVDKNEEHKRQSTRDTGYNIEGEVEGPKNQDEKLNIGNKKDQQLTQRFQEQIKKQQGLTQKQFQTKIQNLIDSKGVRAQGQEFREHQYQDVNLQINKKGNTSQQFQIIPNDQSNQKLQIGNN